VVCAVVFAIGAISLRDRHRSAHHQHDNSKQLKYFIAIQQHGSSLFAYGKQVSQHVTLFLRRAGTVQYIVAIALKPVIHFVHVSNSLRIGGRSRRLDEFAGLGMFALRSRILVLEELLQSYRTLP